MPSVWLPVLVGAFALCACGGRLTSDLDAGDASTDGVYLDADVDASSFPCGEGTKIIQCPIPGECVLVRTATSHAYTCNPGMSCTGTPASAPGDCGCYTGPEGIAYLTICQ
jgi:hypothetical protein